MNAITELLEQLTEAQARLDLTRLQKQELIDQVIPQVIKDQLKEIEVEFDDQIYRAQTAINTLEDMVKTAVIEHGATVKGVHLQAIYSKPRVSWDTAKLDGLMILLPQLKEARKEGAPSVSIRKV